MMQVQVYTSLGEGRYRWPTREKSARELESTHGNGWWFDRPPCNVVAVTQPSLVVHFVKLADNSYNPPFGSGARLTLDSGGYTYVAKDRTTLSFDTSDDLAFTRSQERAMGL
jgi:hypothetical protein